MNKKLICGLLALCLSVTTLAGCFGKTPSQAEINATDAVTSVQ